MRANEPTRGGPDAGECEPALRCRAEPFGRRRDPLRCRGDPVLCRGAAPSCRAPPFPASGTRLVSAARQRRHCSRRARRVRNGRPSVFRYLRPKESSTIPGPGPRQPRPAQASPSQPSSAQPKPRQTRPTARARDDAPRSVRAAPPPGPPGAACSRSSRGGRRTSSCSAGVLPLRPGRRSVPCRRSAACEPVVTTSTPRSSPRSSTRLSARAQSGTAVISSTNSRRTFAPLANPLVRRTSSRAS